MSATPKMDRGDFVEFQNQLKLVVPALLDMQLPEAVQLMDRALAFGPFTAPTAYIEKGEALQVDLEAARILLEAQQKLRKLYPKVAELSDCLARGWQTRQAAKAFVETGHE